MKSSSAVPENGVGAAENAAAKEDAVGELMLLADSFLKKAHSIVNHTHSKNGLFTYFQLVKSSLKCLFTIVQKFHSLLHPQLESVVYYKIARTLFNETESVEKAELYCNKAHQIAHRHGLEDLVMMCEVMKAKIIHRTSPEACSKFVSQCCAKYAEDSAKSSLFNLVQASLTGISRTSMRSLESLEVKEAEFTIHTMLVYVSSLGKAHPEKAYPMVKKIQTIVSTSHDISPQAEAFCVLSRLFFALKVGTHTDIKTELSSLNSFYKSSHKTKWEGWSKDGTFAVAKDSPMRFSFKWLTSQEFCAYFFLLSGIAIALTDANLSKSRKVLKHCFEYTRTERKSLSKHSMSIQAYNNVDSHWRMLKYVTGVFFEWSNLLNDRECLIEDQYIHSVRKACEAAVTSTEQRLYRELLGAICYIQAMVHHSKGNYESACNFYLKSVQNSKSSPQNELHAHSIIQLVFCLNITNSDNLTTLERNIQDMARSLSSHNKEINFFRDISRYLFFNDKQPSISTDDTSTYTGSVIALIIKYFNSTNLEEIENCIKDLVQIKNDASDTIWGLTTKRIISQIQLGYSEEHDKPNEKEMVQLQLQNYKELLQQKVPFYQIYYC